MNRFKTFLILLVSFILQTTIFSKVDIFGANINIIIPAIVAISQVLGPKIGGYSGLFIGLVEDFLFTKFVGVRALTYFIIGSFVGSDRFSIARDKPAGMIMTALATVFHLVFASLIYFILTRISGFSDYLPLPLLVEMILNSLVYLIFIPIVKKVMYIPTYRI